MIDCKELIVNLLKRIDVLKDEKVSAGTKYRLMGLVADIAEVAQGLQEKVLARVSQEVVLFHDTVYNNLCFGREFTLEQVREAARMANADEFVQALPQGYDTVIGDRGMTLSGGQRQRLSIARALLRDPQILLLDEATASLDSQSEHLVQQALDRMLAGRTALIIAHRLSTVQKADEIIVLDKGRIAERGTHSELYAREGLYHHWVKLQEMS